MLRSGYIVGPRADWVWFLGFPFAAILTALACHRWLPMMALASVGLWVTIPHHLSTWLRTYGLREDWERWRWPLIVAPLLIMGTTALGMFFAPTTLLLLMLLWDHQHSIMQQHGLARIYDFKARTGGPLTGRFDLRNLVGGDRVRWGRQQFDSGTRIGNRDLQRITLGRRASGFHAGERAVGNGGIGSERGV